MAIYFDNERLELAKYRVSHNTICHNISCDLCENFLTENCAWNKENDSCDILESIICTLCGVDSNRIRQEYLEESEKEKKRHMVLINAKYHQPKEEIQEDFSEFSPLPF